VVIVDTSAWIEFFRRDGEPAVKFAVRNLLDEFEATLCGPVELEFLGGALRNEKDKLQAWFNILPYARNDQKLWRKAADLYSNARSKGLTIPWNDALIATITFEQNCRVYAIDKHFNSMGEQLGLPLYEPGYGGSFTPEN
jgi:predicted nucleic acid-binding protein